MLPTRLRADNAIANRFRFLNLRENGDHRAMIRAISHDRLSREDDALPLAARSHATARSFRVASQTARVGQPTRAVLIGSLHALRLITCKVIKSVAIPLHFSPNDSTRLDSTRLVSSRVAGAWRDRPQLRGCHHDGIIIGRIRNSDFGVARAADGRERSEIFVSPSGDPKRARPFATIREPREGRASDRRWRQKKTGETETARSVERAEIETRSTRALWKRSFRAFPYLDSDPLLTM